MNIKEGKLIESDIKDALLTEKNIEAFRGTFGTPQGKQTLDIILMLGGFFSDEVNTEQEVGKRNLCTTILKFMGVEEKERSGLFVEAFTDALFRIPIKQKEETNE